MVRPLLPRALAACALALGLVLAGCGSEQAKVVDACGHDLTDVRSTVVAVDAASGATSWSVAVPLAETFLVRSPTGDPEVPLVLRSRDLVLDVATGRVVARPVGGAHEVLVDPGTDTALPAGTVLVDGEARPPVIDVGGLRIGEDLRGGTGADVHLYADGPDGRRWSVVLGPRSEVAAVSTPLQFGDRVVVVASPARPACPSTGG